MTGTHSVPHNCRGRASDRRSPALRGCLLGLRCPATPAFLFLVDGLPLAFRATRANWVALMPLPVARTVAGDVEVGDEPVIIADGLTPSREMRQVPDRRTRAVPASAVRTVAAPNTPGWRAVE